MESNNVQISTENQPNIDSQVSNNLGEIKHLFDKQNEKDTKYVKMSDNFEKSLAFKTACDLIFKGKEQPSGYTEPLLHLNRINKKFNQN